MDDNGTNTQAEPVITTLVETHPRGTETTTFEDGVKIKFRIDYTESGNPHDATLITYYDAAGLETGYDQTRRDGSTYETRLTGPDSDNVITRTLVQKDPLNAHSWIELSSVERYVGDIDGSTHYDNRLSYNFRQIYDDGSANFGEYLFDGDDFHHYRLVSSGLVDAITGVSTSHTYDLGQTTSTTLLDLKDTQDYISIVTTFEGEKVAKETRVNDDGLTVTTDYTDGTAVTRTTIDHGGVRGWASHVLALDADGKPTTGMTINDDGSSVTTTYAGGIRTKADIDLDGADGDLGSVLTFDAAGKLKQTVATTADGLVRTSNYAGDALTDKAVLDAADAFIWAKHISTYDVKGTQTSSFTTYDKGGSILTEFTDGIRSRQVIDHAEASGRLDSERTFDANGILSGTEWTTAKGVVVTTTYADGKSEKRTALDIADAFEFDTHTQSYRDGKVSAAVTTFDTGLVRKVAYDDGVMTDQAFFDGGNDFGWQSRQFALDDKGVVTGIHTVWDDLSVTDTGSFL